MTFLLTKWYLDSVTEEGRAHIGYAAQLSTGMLQLRYGSLLTGAPDQPSELRVRLSAKLPERTDARVDWRVPGLEVAATWRPPPTGHAPLHAELLEEPGALTWDCVLPRAQVELRSGGKLHHGVGYVECLTLREPPWRLPIQTLSWGRAHVGEHTLVWIDWQGARPLRRVYLDGQQVDGDVASDAVRTSGLEVALQPVATLREGDVAKTALGRIPAVTRLLSRHRLHLLETKWLSRASAGRGSAAARGWAIHEVVRWA